MRFIFRRRRDYPCRISGKNNEHLLRSLTIIYQIIMVINLKCTLTINHVTSFFSKLLNNAAFHTSLLACALEVVLATYVG